MTADDLIAAVREALPQRAHRWQVNDPVHGYVEYVSAVSAFAADRTDGAHDAIDRLAARLEEAEKQAALFHRHVEEMIEPRLIADLEDTKARLKEAERLNADWRREAEAHQEMRLTAEARVKTLEEALRNAREEIVEYGSMAPFSKRNYGPALAEIDSLIGGPFARPAVEEQT